MGQFSEAWPAGITMTMNVTYTQANAAGGAVVCEISPGAGNEFIIMVVRAVNSGTNGIAIGQEVAAGGNTYGLLISIASGAGTIANGNVGLVGTGVTSSGTATGIGYPCIVSGTQALRIAQTGAGAQNDTFQVLVNIRTRSGDAPSVIHSNSTNAANVSVTAGVEAFTIP